MPDRADAVRPCILLFTPTLVPFSPRLSRLFDIVLATDAEMRRRAIESHASSVRGVITTGKFGLTADEIARLPNLEIVAVLGIGTENIDAAAVSAAAIKLETRGGTNSDTVADHAIALALTLLRNIPVMHNGVVQGQWSEVRSSRPRLFGHRMGIAGLGNIGAAVARRAAGFDMDVAYFSRSRKSDSLLPFYSDITELAAFSDVLVLCLPGGPETDGIIGLEALRALGPEGYLVNVGRGSVVREVDLIDALEDELIAGAGLDVFENEPEVTQRLRACRNVVLTPHVGGRSPESDLAMVDAVMDSLCSHFFGRPGD
ncbi:D-3-phosphoglycerate dehydrogenase [Hyphomicrobiales bacterium]|nr:D-3-phosphoglycerate dehydrogenase [Hyphomicrobiales bacterium]CAH1692004.1 D-3-phosphoglycerate dehydrogenase [Hyphomicrobiales bacterium]